jgi:cytochrome c2
MRMKIKGRTFIAIVLKNQESLSNVFGRQDATADSFNFTKNTALMGTGVPSWAQKHRLQA